MRSYTGGICQGARYRLRDEKKLLSAFARALRDQARLLHALCGTRGEQTARHDGRNAVSAKLNLAERAIVTRPLEIVCMRAPACAVSAVQKCPTVDYRRFREIFNVNVAPFDRYIFYLNRHGGHNITIITVSRITVLHDTR